MSRETDILRAEIDSLAAEHLALRAELADLKGEFTALKAGLDDKIQAAVLRTWSEMLKTHPSSTSLEDQTATHNNNQKD